jgi:transposase
MPAGVAPAGSANGEARLFGIIRDDAARGMSIRQIASRHHIHRRMVRQALAEPAGPPPRKRGTRPAPAIGPIQDFLDKLADQPLTVWEIWTTVTDQHDSDASYAAVRDYIRSHRQRK